MTSSPRCGRLLQRNERGAAVLEDPVCGRPGGHRGGCLSEAAWARKIAANARGMRAGRPRARPSGSAVLAAAIREARTLAGKSQLALGMSVGVSQQAVQRWEAAMCLPDERNWVQLELTLGPLGIVREGQERSEGEADDAAA